MCRFGAIQRRRTRERIRRKTSLSTSVRICSFDSTQAYDRRAALSPSRCLTLSKWKDLAKASSSSKERSLK